MTTPDSIGCAVDVMKIGFYYIYSLSLRQPDIEHTFSVSSRNFLKTQFTGIFNWRNNWAKTPSY